LKQLMVRLRRAVAAEDGSTLVLYPFAVLIVLGLGGLALDVALYFQAHRESVDVAAGLASDIAGIVDEATFASTGEVHIDRARAQRVVDLTNRDLVGHPYELWCTAAPRTGAPDTVDVECTGRADAILLPVAGLLGDMDLYGTATASARTR
jgi:hypothetical protein